MNIAVKKTVIFLAISLTANILLIVAGVYISNRISTQSNTISTRIESLNKRNLSTENLRDSLAMIKSVGGRIDSFGQFLFTTGDELSLITDFENIAAINNVTYKIVSSNLDNYTDNRIDIVLNVSGPLSNMIKYLSALETYKYVISIQKIEFLPSGSLSAENSAQINANVRLNLSLYAQPTE